MLDLDLQIACAKCNDIPSENEFVEWVTSSLTHEKSSDLKHTELTIRIVDSEEIKSLNLQYRQKDKVTNVLSFPSDLPEDIPLNLLGDIVICNTVVAHEATTQGKSLKDHWAHMVIHGTLHLLGYDHENDDDAMVMESKEIAILKQLKFNNPYI